MLANKKPGEKVTIHIAAEDDLLTGEVKEDSQGRKYIYAEEGLVTYYPDTTDSIVKEETNTTIESHEAVSYENKEKKCECRKCELAGRCQYRDKFQRLPRETDGMGGLGFYKKL